MNDLAKMIERIEADLLSEVTVSAHNPYAFKSGMVLLALRNIEEARRSVTVHQHFSLPTGRMEDAQSESTCDPDAVMSDFEIARWMGVVNDATARNTLREILRNREACRDTNRNLTITITGPQGCGKTRWADFIRDMAKMMTLPDPVVVEGENDGA